MVCKGVPYIFEHYQILYANSLSECLGFKLYHAIHLVGGPAVLLETEIEVGVFPGSVLDILLV